jgi:hypothetical protein
MLLSVAIANSIYYKAKTELNPIGCTTKGKYRDK